MQKMINKGENYRKRRIIKGENINNGTRCKRKYRLRRRGDQDGGKGEVSGSGGK